MHWILQPEPEPGQHCCTPLIGDLIATPGFKSGEGDWLRGQMVVSTELINFVAAQTVGQRDNPLWAAVRKFRFTASNFSDILTAVRLNRLGNNYSMLDLRFDGRVIDSQRIYLFVLGCLTMHNVLEQNLNKYTHCNI